MPGKKKLKKFWNEKARARALSGVVAAAMILTVMSGLFLLPQQVSADGDSYTEDYEDDTTGNYPSDSWYSFEENGQWEGVSVTTDQANSGTKAMNFTAVASSYDSRAWMNFSSALIKPKFINFTYYVVSSAKHDYWRVSAFGGTDFSQYYSYLCLGYPDFGDNAISVKTSSTGKYDTGIDFPFGQWCKVSLQFNWTTYKYMIHSDNGTQANSEWYDFYAGVTSDRVAGLYISGYTNDCAIYIDDWYIGNGTENSPPTCSITSPSNGATVSGTVSIQGTASDSDGTVQSVQVKIGSDAWATASGTTSWSYSWDTTGYADGSYTILARSYDGTDYSTEDSITVTVDNVADTDPSVSLSGLTSGKLTWSGTAPGSYWCNATGAGHETLNIAITGGSGTNDTDVTQINITVPGDLTNGSNTIDPSAITLYVSVDNSTFHDMGAFPTNGGTIVLNATTWTWADDPFPISGDDNIYCRFKITYADGQAAGIYTKTGVTVSILG